MARILSVQERLKLFKEINRVHKELYGWKMAYENAWYGASRIDIDRDVILRPKEDVPIGNSQANEFYFSDDKGRDITLLKGLFAWQAYYFYHVNPYKFEGHYRPTGAQSSERQKLTEDDFVIDELGKRVRPDIGHPVECLESYMGIQQRREDGKIWITSNWLTNEGVAPSFGEDLFNAIEKAARGDGKALNGLRDRFEAIDDANRHEFEEALGKYFRGGSLEGRYWHGGYAYAASREWRIKTREELDAALEAEERHFWGVIEAFMQWLRVGELHLGVDVEEELRKGLRETYANYPLNLVKRFATDLMEHDKVEPSDVYLWWGGEPGSDLNYAYVTLYFEVDPGDVGTPKFDEEVSRNLRTLINIAESESAWLSDYRECRPNVWRAIFT